MKKIGHMIQGLLEPVCLFCNNVTLIISLTPFTLEIKMRFQSSYQDHTVLKAKWKYKCHRNKKKTDWKGFIIWRFNHLRMWSEERSARVEPSEATANSSDGIAVIKTEDGRSSVLKNVNIREGREPDNLSRDDIGFRRVFYASRATHSLTRSKLRRKTSNYGFWSEDTRRN